MFANDSDKPGRFHSQKGVVWMLVVGVILALAGNVYQFARSAHLANAIAANERSTQLEIRKLADTSSAALQLDQQRFDALKDQLQASSAATLQQARSEVKRSG